jgi:hypothetical protein
MNDFIEKDYVEHWETGIGKILKIDKDSLLVDFMNKGNIVIPIKKIGSLKKLNQDGLLAQIYDHPQHIQSLIEKKSTEIIKFLIYDEDATERSRIDRSRIKFLLTKAEDTERGWRAQFGLVSKKEWKKWWTNISKKLREDPWFDTSSRRVIRLRQHPLSPAQNVYETFLAEQDTKRKLTLCEKLINLLRPEEDQSILKAVKDYITESLKTPPEDKNFSLVVLNYIQCIKNDIEIQNFDEKAYDLTFQSLIKRDLSVSKFLSIYDFFSNLPLQHIADHLLVFLHSGKKLRDKIGKTLKEKEDLKQTFVEVFDNEAITEKQISIINALRFNTKESIQEGFTNLTELFQNDGINNFLEFVLLSSLIDGEVKTSVSEVVEHLQSTSIIYNYFNRVQVSSDQDILFLQKFLKVLGATNADLAFRHILLSEKTALERPDVFLSAFRSLVTSSDLCIDERQRQFIISHVSQLLSSTQLNGRCDDLKLHITKIIADTPTQEELDDTFEDQELLNLVRAKLTPLPQRLAAINKLLERGLRSECQALAIDLVTGISENELLLIERILEHLPDAELAKTVLTGIIEQLDFSKDSLNVAVLDFLEKANLTDTFAECILFDNNETWHIENHPKIIELVGDHNMMRSIIRYGMERIILDPDIPMKFLQRFSAYSSSFGLLTLQEIKEIWRENVLLSDKELERVKDDYDKKVNTILEEHDEKLFDAIDRTTQRYEEYLKRLIPLVSEIDEVTVSIEAKIKDKETKPFSNEIINKLRYMKDDIEGLLKILEIIPQD